MKRNLEKLSHTEWLLKRPDAFIGSIQPTESEQMLICSDSKGKTEIERVCVSNLSPALVRLATELTTNALDNARRCSTQKKIDVRVDSSSITVENDGDSLPIEPFECGSDRLTPTVAFSEFMSSTNYDDDGEERLGAGRNGVGAKGVNVYAKQFTVEIQNGGKVFKQVWEDNMTNVTHLSVKKTSAKRTFTRIRWVPDFCRLGMDEEMTADQMRVLESLAYHLSLCSPKSLSVSLNGTKLSLRSTEQLALSLGAMSPIATDDVLVDGVLRLSFSVGAREEGLEPCIFSFVNGSQCNDGTHIKHLLSKVQDILSKKVGKDVKVGPSFLRGEMVVVATLLVPNPRYGNQQKTELTTPTKEYGFSYSPTDRFQSKLLHTDLVSRMVKAGKDSLDKKLSSTKKGRVSVPKYQPAEKLRSGRATLIVTEGDSALNFAVAGLGIIGRKHYGVFPIRGKLLNCLNASKKKLVENQEINNLLQILGLEVGKEYPIDHDGSLLNYENVMILSDQDPDGSHIRGLIITFLHALFPSLLIWKPTYVLCFSTPLLRIHLGPKGSPPIDFYSEVEHRKWREEREKAGLSLGSSVYYKGLGALPHALAKEFFSKLDSHTTSLEYTGPLCSERISLFFDESMSDQRKEYLSKAYDPSVGFDFSLSSSPIHTWCDQDLSHFCMYNNSRTFPSAIDGLKTSQRKVLSGCLRLNLSTKKDMKVFQLTGRIASDMCYHHGDASLTNTIVGMAAEHSNNVCLLWPEGQFGSHMCHKAASSRYISTTLEPISRFLFRKEDDPVLTYLEDEGSVVEPRHYVPIIPMVLVNGASGIGTGWSTDCPSFHPLDVISCIEQGGGYDSLLPWYRGNSSTIQNEGDGSFTSRGFYTITDNDIIISSLPVGSKETNEVVEDLKRQFSTVAIDVFQKSTPFETRIVIHSSPSRLKELDETLLAKLLTKRISLSNVHLWGSEGKLSKYDVRSIFVEHERERIALYEKRISHEVSLLQEELIVASSKRKYIQMVRSGELSLSDCESKEEVESRLSSFSFSLRSGSYNYLTCMPQYALTRSEASKLEEREAHLELALEESKSRTSLSLWKEELDELKVALHAYDGRCLSERPQLREYQ